MAQLNLTTFDMSHLSGADGVRGYVADYSIDPSENLVVKTAEIMSVLSQGNETIHVFLIEWDSRHTVHYFADGYEAQRFEDDFRCQFNYWEGR